MKVIWVDSAEADVRDIFEYLLERNPTAAERTASGLVEAAKPLHDNPRYGTSIPQLPGLSKIIVRPTRSQTRYLLIYRYQPERGRILILRVIHGKRQWRELLGGKTPR